MSSELHRLLIRWRGRAEQGVAESTAQFWRSACSSSGWQLGSGHTEGTIASNRVRCWPLLVVMAGAFRSRPLYLKGDRWQNVLGGPRKLSGSRLSSEIAQRSPKNFGAGRSVNLSILFLSPIISAC